MAASGEALRQAREARGLSVDDIAQTLKLAPRQVEAIEAEAFGQLPGIAFARGFVRNYARYLGLDPAPLLERLNPPQDSPAMRLAPESNADGSMPLPSGYRSTSLTPALVVLGGLALLVFAAWHFNLLGSLNARRGGTGALPAIQSGTTQSVSEPVFPPHTEETAVVTAQVEPPLASPVAATSAPVRASAPAVAVSVAGVSGTAASQNVGASPLVLSIEQDAWIEVRDGGGRMVVARMGKAGETLEVRGRAPFSLKVGNAPHVKLRYQGQPVDLSAHTKADVARLTLK